MKRKFTAWLTVNRACNLRCNWCYAKMMNFSGKENMDIDTVKKILNFLKGLNVESVILIGGEPTIHPNFLEIVKLTKETGFRPLLVTNSIMLSDKKFLKEIIEAGLDGITTSFKANSPNKYRELAGKDVFSDVMQAVSNIESFGISHKVSITVCDSMFDDFEKTLDVAVRSGTKFLALDMERPVIVKNRTYVSGKSTPQDTANFFSFIYPKVDNCGIRTSIKISIPFCLFSSNILNKMVEKKQLISGCQMFRGGGIIFDTKGRVIPCNQFCDNPLGELGIDFESADDFLLFRKRPDIRSFYKDVSSCPDQKCVDCREWKFCGGGCRIHWLHWGVEYLLGNKKQKGGDNSECPTFI